MINMRLKKKYREKRTAKSVSNKSSGQVATKKVRGVSWRKGTGLGDRKKG